MGKVSFGGSTVIPTTTEEKLFNIKIKHPLLIKGLEINVSVPKDEIKDTIEELANVWDELNEDDD